MRVRVLLFGPEAAVVGRDSVEVDSGDAATVTCARIERSLGESFPVLRPTLASARFAINGEFAQGRSAQVREGDEVALIGLVSGG